MDITTATPVEIDTAWAELDRKYFGLIDRLGNAMDNLHRVARDRKGHRGTRSVWLKSNEEVLAEVQTIAETATIAHVADHAKKTLDGVNAIHTALAANSAEIAKLQDEFNNRGGWNRAFLAITNGKGHVHSSQDCSTCNNGQYRTQFDWMINWSDATMEQIIEDAGERACTVCYPAAPVGAKAPASKMFSVDEIAAAAAREARKTASDAKEAKAAASAITAPDGSPLKVVVGGYGETFKTERAASQWLIRHLGEHKVYGYRFDALAVATVIEALAAKHQVGAETEGPQIAAKSAAWIKREEREAAKVAARINY